MTMKNFKKGLQDRLKSDKKYCKAHYTNGQLRALEEISDYLSNGSAPITHRKLKNLLARAGYDVIGRNGPNLIRAPHGEYLRGKENRPLSLSHKRSELSNGIYQKVLKAVYEDYKKFY